MNMDGEDFADSPYYDEIVEHVSKEAVENFTSQRLCALYDKEPAIAEKPFKTLAEARLLVQTPHHTAAFIHAAIASEVMLKGIILKPILQGFVHSDSIAPFIVELAFSSSGLGRIKKLLAKIFQDVCKLDLMTHRRIGGAKPLWDEIIEVQTRRDLIMHRAEVATKDEAEHAIAVATAVTVELFPVFAKSLGYHLHDGFRLCGDQYCLSHPEYGERNRMILGGK
jgi:hypothetical protein